MDIHKPKAAHSWREFAIEIGTIICGILIALGLEQAVEAVHRGAEVREARAALRAEIGRNMMVATAEPMRNECDTRYLARYVAWAHGGSPPAPDHRNFPFARSTVWDVSKAGAAGLMPLEERTALANFYSQAADYNTMVDRQRTFSLRVAEFYGLDRLTPEDDRELLRTIQAYRSASQVVESISKLLLRYGRAAGVEAWPVDAETKARVAAICKVANAP
jgi:hypothetical protein